jgi:hypothetical protein
VSDVRSRHFSRPGEVLQEEILIDIAANDNRSALRRRSLLPHSAQYVHAALSLLVIFAE